MDPVTAIRTTATYRSARGPAAACRRPAATGTVPGTHEAGTPAVQECRPRGARVPGVSPGRTGQLKLSPQAQELPALGLSMVKPCFSIVSAKSIVAPPR